MINRSKHRRSVTAVSIQSSSRHIVPPSMEMNSNIRSPHQTNRGMISASSCFLYLTKQRTMILVSIGESVISMLMTIHPIQMTS